MQGWASGRVQSDQPLNGADTDTDKGQEAGRGQCQRSMLRPCGYPLALARHPTALAAPGRLTGL